MTKRSFQPGDRVRVYIGGAETVQVGYRTGTVHEVAASGDPVVWFDKGRREPTLCDAAICVEEKP